MRTETMEAEISIVQEPQLDILYYPKITKKHTQENETLNVLSLFSGCGGMDLGFEGGFSVLQQSINEILTPHFIDKKFKEANPDYFKQYYLKKKQKNLIDPISERTTI